MSEATEIKVIETPVHPNIKVVQDYLETVKTGDFKAAAELFDENVKIRIPGRNQISGEYHGSAGVFASFGKMLDLSGGTYHITEFVDWLASDSRVCLLARQEATRDGETYSYLRNIVFKIADGKMRDIQIFEADQHEFDDFWK